MGDIGGGGGNRSKMSPFQEVSGHLQFEQMQFHLKENSPIKPETR